MTTALHRAAHWHRPLMLFASAMAVLAVVSAVGVFVDPRIVTGAPIWLKPFKFSLSFVLYATTLAWMLSLLPRRSRIAEWAATVVIAASVIEMVAIVTQVVRGTASHFNDTTPFNALVFNVMGGTVTVLFTAHLVIALVLLIRRIPDRVAASAVRLGLGLSALGMAAAVPMVLPMQAPGIAGITGAHAVGVPDGGPGLPVTDWSTTGGDLRIGHFVGLHGLQALPILAILLTRYATRLDARTKVRLLRVAAVAYALLTAMLTWQALRGQPLLRPDALTLAAAGGLLTATALAAGAVLLAGRRRPAIEPEPIREPVRELQVLG
jgi:hypothetical protein